MRRKWKSPSRFARKLSLTRLEERETPAVSAVGSQFQVNTFTTNNQSTANVASDADGDFVAVWQSFNQDGSNNGIYGQRYSAAGATLGSEFLVNTQTFSSQTSPVIGMDALGNFVVVWSSFGQDGSQNGVFAQRFDAAGVRAGPEFQVNNHTTIDQQLPAVAMDATGNFVVAWESNGQEVGTGAGIGIFARRYGADGLPRGGEFQVNTFTTGNQQNPDLAINANGDFAIVWVSNGQDGDGQGIYGQRYSAAGSALGGEFQVNTFTTGPQTAPSVGMDAAGNFTVAWQTQNQASATSGFDIFQRRFNAAGSPLGNDTLAAFAFAANQTAPDVARSATGQYVVGYVTESGANLFVRGQVFDAFGASVSGELSFNSTGSSGFQSVGLASDAEGDFVAAWSGEGTGDSTGVFARRFDESVDAAGPWVVSVSSAGEPTRIDRGERIANTVSQLVVAFSENMNVTGGTSGANSVLNPGFYTLTRNGASVVNLIANNGFTFNTTTRRFELTLVFSADLTAGDYVFGLRASIEDLNGNALDGDLDGSGASNVSTSWRIAPPVATGPEFRVNTTTSGAQSLAAIVSDPGGNYVVVWESPDGSNEGVFARRFANDGSPLTGEIAVNTFTTGGQRFPRVASDAAGNFVVVWESVTGQDGDGQGVFGRRFAANGSPLSNEFQVNPFATGFQGTPHVAMNATGEFVVSYSSAGQDGSQNGVYARRYAADGSAGAEFRANAFTTNSQLGSKVAMDAFGRFVIAWESDTQDGSGAGAYFRRFDANGALDAADIRANGTTAGEQRRANVAVAASGDFVVVWDSENQDGSGAGVYARRYDETGTALGAEFRVSNTTTGDQDTPLIAIDADGDYSIVWESDPTGADQDVFVRRYSAAGDAQGLEQRVNATTSGNQVRAGVASDADGDLLVIWHGSGPGDSTGVFAQRFAQVPPPRVASVQVNDGSAQRSRVTSLTIGFDSQVTISGALAGAITLSRIGGGFVAFTGAVSVVNNVTQVVLNNFSGAETELGSLRDGRYTLTVRGDKIAGPNGSLDGDGDGFGGDNGTFGDAQGLFRFYGDMNGDRRIDISDFGFFSLAYLSIPNFNPALDFNNDGRIDISDFGQFSVRFFTTLP